MLSASTTTSFITTSATQFATPFASDASAAPANTTQDRVVSVEPASVAETSTHGKEWLFQLFHGNCPEPFYQQEWEDLRELKLDKEGVDSTTAQKRSSIIVDLQKCLSTKRLLLGDKIEACMGSATLFQKLLFTGLSDEDKKSVTKTLVNLERKLIELYSEIGEWESFPIVDGWVLAGQSELFYSIASKFISGSENLSAKESINRFNQLKKLARNIIEMLCSAGDPAKDKAYRKEAQKQIEQSAEILEDLLRANLQKNDAEAVMREIIKLYGHLLKEGALKSGKDVAWDAIEKVNTIANMASELFAESATVNEEALAIMKMAINIGKLAIIQDDYAQKGGLMHGVFALIDIVLEKANLCTKKRVDLILQAVHCCYCYTEHALKTVRKTGTQNKPTRSCGVQRELLESKSESIVFALEQSSLLANKLFLTLKNKAREHHSALGGVISSLSGIMHMQYYLNSQLNKYNLGDIGSRRTVLVRLAKFISELQKLLFAPEIVQLQNNAQSKEESKEPVAMQQQPSATMQATEAVAHSTATKGQDI